MQTTHHILMVRPAGFGYNVEAAQSNAFQHKPEENSDITQVILDEFDGYVSALRDKGVEVHVFEDTPYPVKPDAIFPNNWITMHADGTITLFPMAVCNRRHEVRGDFVEKLESEFRVEKVVDLTHLEAQNRFLEGTGSIIYDHANKTAYACLSPRTDKHVFEELCASMSYKPVTFTSVDGNGKEIYHTNVMMHVGSKCAVVCFESILNQDERKLVESSLTDAGFDIVDITLEQVNQFAGNMLEVKSKSGEAITVMSQSALDALTEAQKGLLAKSTTLLPVQIPTIENIGGGSARCMMAEIFLPMK